MKHQTQKKMKTYCWQVLRLFILLCIVGTVYFVCQPCKNPVVRRYDNGYFVTEKRVKPGLIKWTLWHSVKKEAEQVTELIVVDNNIVAFMPTILHDDGCVQRHPDIRTKIKGLYALGATGGSQFTFGIGPNKPNLKTIEQHVEKAMTLSDFSNSVYRIKGYTSQMSSVLEIETPSPIILFDEVISGLSQFSGRGISIIPAVQHTPAHIPYHPQPDDSTDIKVDVHGL